MIRAAAHAAAVRPVAFAANNLVACECLMTCTNKPPEVIHTSPIPCMSSEPIIDSPEMRASPSVQFAFQSPWKRHVGAMPVELVLQGSPMQRSSTCLR